MPTKQSPIHSKLMRGEPVEYDTALPEEERKIPSAWVAEALRKGQRVELKNAILTGLLDLRSVHVEEEFILLGGEVRGPIHAFYARFARWVMLHDVSFHDSVNFRGARFADELNCRGSRFLKDVSLEDGTIEGSLIAPAAEFGSSETDNIAFSGCEIGRAVNFKLAVFHGPAQFISLTVRKQANFNGVQFNQKAAFDGAEVGGGLYFRSVEERRVEFVGEARFQGIKVGGNAEFIGTRFKQSAEFSGAKINGHLFFRPEGEQRVEFGGKVRFLGIRVGGQTNFRGARFEQDVTFAQSEIGGSLFFFPEGGHRVEFGGKVAFLGIKVLGQANFRGARFEQEVAFDRSEIGGSFFFSPDGKERVEFRGKASFQGVRAKGQANFSEAVFEGHTFFEEAEFFGGPFFRMTTFIGPASFTAARFRLAGEFQSATFAGLANLRYARFEQEIHFAGAKFHDGLNLRDAHMTTLSFREGDKVAGFDEKSKVDLLGCAYERLEIDDWRQLMTRQAEFSPRPWSHLENVFRASGNDADADAVYYDRRQLESNQIRFGERPARWLVDRFERSVAGYGVKNGLVVLYLVNVLLLGSLVFNLPGALVPVGDTALAYPLTTTDLSSALWNWFSSLGHSVRYLLPIDIPLHRQWQPAYGFFSLYASIHMLLGVVFITTAFATVSGLLRRAHPD